MNVAELIALLQQHGISPPVKTEAASTARMPAAAASDSATDALAVEPEEVTLDTGTGFIRCPNCNTGLTMFAAIATSVDGITTCMPSTPAVNMATGATSASARAPTASTSTSTVASIMQPGPVTSTSRSARWYAVTRGREIGVFYGRW
ncbi:hypothetical protein PLEOSDRAFT_1086432 [Pleurotus ostreatus PC15]|uniref:Uncharacterized protein n=1 Tax=Pleurotus ostreatus (strain PC15) TaxID=1137138 RepID=A0A067NJ44_PLEO1|nr:hypothetical protein PLEOSDRAFT_1086432 [Pleurotus ostreatus PC15]